MTNDMNTQFLCKDCENYKLCEYYHGRKETSYICKYFHIEPKTGHWEFFCQHWRKCSECGYPHKFAEDWNYCPNCGARMVEQKPRGWKADTIILDEDVFMSIPCEPQESEDKE